ncbi:MAG: putative PEP-binding protein [Phycisphaerales bacterium]
MGLCRTEHMFFDTEERRLAMQRMIVADTEQERARGSPNSAVPASDFIGIFEAMDGRPGHDPAHRSAVARVRAARRARAARLAGIGVPFEKVRDRVEALHEANPMLGHRGCRLCVSHPEILEMQVRAIIEAACNCKKRRVPVMPEIMIPLTIDRKELRMLVAQTRRVADAVLAEQDVRLAYLVGTMIETPRAALLAQELAEVSEFFSFGTNDLTQMTMGLSRDDARQLLPIYVDKEKAAICRHDPFQSIDVEGVACW